MNREERINKGIFAFMLGLALRLSDALDIIHELCHYAWANIEGIAVTEMTWSSISYAKESALVLYGGYMGEFTLYGLIVLFLSLNLEQGYGKVKIGHKVKASFFLGILIVSWLTSFISLDFNDHALKSWDNQASVTRVLIMWGIWSSFWLWVPIMSTCRVSTSWVRCWREGWGVSPISTSFPKSRASFSPIGSTA